MDGINFFSKSRYLHLPSANNPRVSLVIDTKEDALNAFKLYNPFSVKAKVFKKVAAFFFINFNAIFKHLFVVERTQKSEFIAFIEKKLKCELHASVYNATAKDKVVLQLQSKNKIVGYLKFPLNKEGIVNIKNEANAIALLSKRGIIAPALMTGEYKETPFLILPELKGRITTIHDEDIDAILGGLRKEQKYKLESHPRVHDLKKEIQKLKLPKEYQLIFDILLQNSKESYHETYEHGDFAPWNIIKTNTGFIPFDFEFFVEDGIDYFDAIKYHFQVGRLLKNKSCNALLTYIYSKIKPVEPEIIVSLFLFKEIIALSKLDKDYSFEEQMLRYING